MNKEFVTYQQGLQLKELGFDEPCWAWWHIEDCDIRFCYSEQRSPIINSRETEIVGLPTYSQVFRWFREKYDLRIWIESNHGVLFYEYIIVTTNPSFINKQFTNNEVFNSYEESEQACLNNLIEIIKNK